MTDLLIEGEIADQLRDLAKREGRTVEDVLETLIERYAEPSPSPTLSQLAQSLADADFHSGRSDTASSSREILDTEYAEYLNRRTRGKDNGAH